MRRRRERGRKVGRERRRVVSRAEDLGGKGKGGRIREVKGERGREKLIYLR